MPIGLINTYRPSEDNPIGEVPAQTLQLPTRQVDPYMRTLIRLQDSGLLSERFVQDQIASPALRQQIADTGLIGPRQPFGPGQSNLTDEERTKLRNLRSNVSLREGDHTVYIPREHTEPSGWIKMLEIFGAFNFAAAGAANALVNLYQGKEDETNPFVEAYRGFTLKDKEVFGDVLQSMGWEGDDGYAYWSRETLGFIMDVVVDPINFISLGSPQAAKLAKGIATKVALRGSAVLGNTTIKPVEELSKVTRKIVEEGLEKVSRGEAFQIGAVGTQKRVQNYQEIVARHLEPGVEVDSLMASVRETQESVARMALEDGVSTDVNAAFAMLARRNDVRTLRKLLEETRGNPRHLEMWLAALGGDSTGVITGDILRHFLGMENKTLTPDNIMKFLTEHEGGIKQLIDPGGLQLRVPFTDKGFVIAEAQWLDEFALNVEAGISKSLGVAATYTPEPVKKTLAMVAEGISKTTVLMAHRVGQAFGANARRSGVLYQHLQGRATRLKSAQRNAEDQTQQLLTWTLDGKEEYIPEGVQEVLVDTLLAEQGAAYNHLKSGQRFFDEQVAREHIHKLRTENPTEATLREADELESSLTPLGYEEKHIPNLGREGTSENQALEALGFNQQARVQLVDVARRIHQTFTTQFDAAADAGVATVFMDYYLPLQYSNWTKVKNVQLGRGNDISRLQGNDVFAKARTITPEEARDLGLTPSKNLYALIYNRLFEGRRTQIERKFLTKVIDSLGVHPGQIGQVLRRMYGPESIEGQELLEVLLNQSNYEDLLTTDNLNVLIPDLEELKQYVQTGSFDDALRWIEGREELVPLLATGEGRTAFFDAMQNDIQQGMNSLSGYLNTVGEGFDNAENKLSQVLGDSVEDVTKLIEDLGITDEGSATLGAALRTLLTEKLQRVLPEAALGRMTPLDLLKRTTGGYDWISLPARAGADTGKIAVLMNALDDSAESGARITDDLLRRLPELDGQLDEIAADLAESITTARSAAGDHVVVSARIEEQLLEMSLSGLPAATLERFVAHSIILPSRGVSESAVYAKLQEIMTATVAEDTGKVARLTDELISQYPAHPDLNNWYNDWRASHGLPADPSLPATTDRIALRKRIIQTMNEAKEKTHEAGLSMFRRPVYAPGGQTPAGAARHSALSKLRDRIRGELGPNGERYFSILDHLMTPTQAMPGYHYSPGMAIKSAVLQLYGAEGSAVLGLITETAAKLEPHAVVERIFKEKMVFGGLVRNLVGQPEHLESVLEKVSKGTTQRIAGALENMARVGGADPAAAKSLVLRLERDLDEILGFQLDLDEIHKATASAFDQFSEGLAPLLERSPVTRELMTGSIAQMRQVLLESNQKTLTLFQRARNLSRQVTRLTEDPAGVIGRTSAELAGGAPPVHETVMETAQEMISLRDDVQKAMDEADEATALFLQPNDPRPAGWKEITDEQKISNALLDEAEQLNRNMEEVYPENQQLLDSYNESRLAIATTTLSDAKHALAVTDHALIGVETKINDAVTQVGYVRQAQQVQESATRELAVLQERVASGNGLSSTNQEDAFRTFLEVAVADEFLRGQDYTPTGWAAAAAQVASKGPRQQILSTWWREAIGEGAINDAVLFKELEGIVTGSPLRVADAQLWAAQRRPPILSGPTGEDVRGAAEAAINAVDQGFLDDVGIHAQEIIDQAVRTAKNASAFRQNTEGIIGRMADGAFLPDETLREMAESVHYEREFVDALVKELSAKQGLVESLFGMRSPAGQQVLVGLRTDLQDLLIRQRGALDSTAAQELGDEVNSLAAELLVMATADHEAAILRLTEIAGAGPEVQPLIQKLTDASTALSKLPKGRKFRDLISGIKNSVDDLYRPVADLLDDQASSRVLAREGVPQVFLDNLAQHPNDPIAQGLGISDGVPSRLQPGELQALEQLMNDINGPTGASPEPLLAQLQNLANQTGGAVSNPSLPKRAQYWLYRFGQNYGGEALGTAGLTANQSNVLLERLGRYFDRGRGVEAVGNAEEFLVTGHTTLAGREVPGKLVALRNEAAPHYESRAVLVNEIEALEQEIARTESGTLITDRLEYSPEQAETWRGMYAMRNYLKLQVRRAEHLALKKTLQQLPSRSELSYLLYRAQMGALDAEPAALEALQNMRLAAAPGGRGVLSSEQTVALADLTGARRAGIEEQGKFVFAHAGKKVRELTGIDFENLAIDYASDVPASQQFLEQVGIELEKLGPERFANMGGSDGARLIQELDGELVVAGSVNAPGMLTDANSDFANGVAQVHEYLKLVEVDGRTLSNVPALSLQKRQLTKALDNFFPGAGVEALNQRKLLLQSVVGHQDIDRLSSSEAAAVLYFLQTNTDPTITRHGFSTVNQLQRAEMNLLGARDRGLFPKELEDKYRRGLLDADELLEEYEKLGFDPSMPDAPVAMRFPGMRGDVDTNWGLPGRDLGQPIFVPRWFQDAIADSVTPEGEVGVVARGMLKGVDAITNSFKWAMTLPWPAFHFRNVLDATVRTFFALGVKGLSPTWNRKVFEIMRGNSSAKMTFNGVEYNADALLNMFEDLGGQVSFADKIGKTALQMDVTDPRVLSPFSDNFVMKGASALNDGASTIAGTGDNFFRLSIWLDAMDKGMGASGAMDFAQKFLFDYAHGLTPFERGYMRRIFPFYTFSRFNVPLQLELMFKRPGMISAMGKTHNLLSESRVDPIEELLPSYVREQWRFGPKLQNGQLQIWSGRNLLATEELGFLGDLATWRGKDTPEVFADEVFSRLNPMLKIPVELYVGHNLFFDSKIAEDQTIRGAVLDWPVVRDFLQMRKVTVGSGADQQLLYRVNGNRYHLLNQLHFSRIYRTLVQTIGPGDQSAWERFVPFVTGLRLTSIDLGRRLQHLQATANFNQENIRKALSQGDTEAVKRILGLTERQPYQRAKLVEQVQALQSLTSITSK